MRRLGALGVLTLGWSLACGSGTTLYTIDTTDEAVILDMAELDQRLGINGPAPTGGTWKKYRSLGAWELEYEIETEAVYYKHAVTIEPNPGDAVASYTGLKIGMKLLGDDEVELVEANELLRWGDAHECLRMVMDGTTVGTSCVARKDHTVFQFMLSTLPIEGAGAVDALLAPELAALASYKPAKTAVLPEAEATP